ncbi:MAG TPA: UpxY family transcription antiterminator [Nitrospirota bacterium]|nr:UpxY family transcription antiterminator [Nitrospirota bacterium]
MEYQVLDHAIAEYEPAAMQEATTSISPWYVVYVKSRHEFVVHDELLRKGMEALLPSYRKTSQWKDRRKLIEHPLFPGYVFVKVPAYPGAFLYVLKTRGIVTFVSLESSTPTPVDPEEIASLRLLMESGRHVEIYPHLKEGTRVRVKNGPLQNAEGILSRKENDYLFSVNVELLGRSVAVKISAEDIDAA